MLFFFSLFSFKSNFAVVIFFFFIVLYFLFPFSSAGYTTSCSQAFVCVPPPPPPAGVTLSKALAYLFAVVPPTSVPQFQRWKARESLLQLAANVAFTTFVFLFCMLLKESNKISQLKSRETRQLGHRCRWMGHRTSTRGGKPLAHCQNRFLLLTCQKEKRYTALKPRTQAKRKTTQGGFSVRFFTPG